jgi:hypothetical protein
MRVLQDSYGGMNPYMDTVYTDGPTKDAILARGDSPKLHLRVVKGCADRGGPAWDRIGFLESGQAYSP